VDSYRYSNHYHFHTQVKSVKTPHILVIRPKVTDCPCEEINARKGVNIIKTAVFLLKYEVLDLPVVEFRVIRVSLY
jgi:hypothetical protein